MFITGRDYRVNRASDPVDIMLHTNTCYAYRNHGTGRYWLTGRFETVEQAEDNFREWRVRTHPSGQCLRGQGTHLPPLSERRT